MRMRKKEWARPELAVCPYFIQEPEKLAGNWNNWFPRRQPLHVELGCGKGVFTAEIAFRNPQINYLGIDLSPDVLGVARRNVERLYGEGNRPVDNLAFTAYNIEQIENIIHKEDAVERIYINFCNPWPKGKHHKKRLTHFRQLIKYKAFLMDGGEIHFKTDNSDLYLATLRYFRESGFEILYETKDLYKENCVDNVKTEHEIMFASQGIPIKKVIARYRRDDGNS